VKNEHKANNIQIHGIGFDGKREKERWGTNRRHFPLHNIFHSWTYLESIINPSTICNSLLNQPAGLKCRLSERPDSGQVISIVP
jgi:hypothetical protein